MKKYLVCPGTVISKIDGDEHYVDAGALIYLYDVDPRDCVISNTRKPQVVPDHLLDLIVLKPRHDGDYPVFRKK